jgi:hypothetical protein
MKQALIQIFSLVVTLWLLIGCNLTKNLAGTYQVKDSSELMLYLNEDSTFTLYNITAPIYRHPCENDSSYFWFTKGQWLMSKRSVVLTSDSNLTYQDSSIIISTDTLDFNGYELIFLDYKKDTIPSIAVYAFDSMYFAGRYTNKFRLEYNEIAKSVSDEKLLIPKDAIEIEFIGYQRVHLPHTEIIGQTLTIQLYPLSNADAFDEHILKIRRNALIDKLYGFKFIKLNTAGNKK